MWRWSRTQGLNHQGETYTPFDGELTTYLHTSLYLDQVKLSIGFTSWETLALSHESLPVSRLTAQNSKGTLEKAWSLGLDISGINTQGWTSAVVQWLRLHASTGGGLGSTPGGGTKIPTRSWCTQLGQKQTTNKQKTQGYYLTSCVIMGNMSALLSLCKY